MKRIGLVCILQLCIVLSGCAAGLGGEASTSPTGAPDVSSYPIIQQAATTSPPGTSDTQNFLFHNNQYGFEFMLPLSWQGYSILESKWEGLSVAGERAGQVVESGPELILRHPLWTTENPRQDIPILIFTFDQWNALQQEAFSIGAAPVGPSELGRNSRYVFALPARYNYAYPAGYEEVETILDQQPLKPREPSK